MGLFSSSKTNNVSNLNTTNEIEVNPITNVQNTYDFNAAGQALAGSFDSVAQRAANSLDGITTGAGATVKNLLGFGASMTVLVIAVQGLS